MKRRLMELAGIVHRSEPLKGRRLLKEEPEDDAGDAGGDDAGGAEGGDSDSSADSLFGDDSGGGGLGDDSGESGDSGGDDASGGEEKPTEPEEAEPKLPAGDIEKFGETDVEEPIYDAVESAFDASVKAARVGAKHHRGKPGETYISDSLHRYSLGELLFEKKDKEKKPARVDLANFDMQSYANEIAHKIKYYTTQFDWQGMILNIAKQFLLNNIHEKEANQAVQEFEELLARVEDLDHLIDDYDDPEPIHTAVGAVGGGGGGV